MATEEIGLTDHLEAQGIHAVETDLGEWIIQLAGERPSHLIAPAIRLHSKPQSREVARVHVVDEQPRFAMAGHIQEGAACRAWQGGAEQAAEGGV